MFELRVSGSQSITRPAVKANTPKTTIGKITLSPGNCDCEMEKNYTFKIHFDANDLKFNYLQIHGRNVVSPFFRSSLHSLDFVSVSL